MAFHERDTAVTEDTVTLQATDGKSSFAARIWFLLAICLGLGLSHLSTSTMPLEVGALMDATHRSAAQAGYFGFCQVGALALGMIMLAGWVDRMSPWKIAIGGCLLIVLADVGLYMGGTFPSQLALGVVSGFGYGAVYSAVVAAAAATREPDRMYAIGNGGALMVIVSLMSVFPSAQRTEGQLGLFLIIAAVAFIAAPLMSVLRRGAHGEHLRITAWRTPGAPGLLIAWATFSAGTGGLYAFAERIGVHIGLPSNAIAWVLSAGVFTGLIGTTATAVLGSRVNRPAALLAGILGSALSCLMVGFAWSLESYAAGVFAYWICTMFSYSYLLGTAARLDRTGRVGTLGSGCERFGFASGTAVAGLLAEHWSYSMTGVFGFATCALGMSAGFPTLFRELQHR